MEFARGSSGAMILTKKTLWEAGLVWGIHLFWWRSTALSAMRKCIKRRPVAITATAPFNNATWADDHDLVISKKKDIPVDTAQLLVINLSVRLRAQ